MAPAKRTSNNSDNGPAGPQMRRVSQRSIGKEKGGVMGGRRKSKVSLGTLAINKLAVPGGHGTTGGRKGTQTLRGNTKKSTGSVVSGGSSGGSSAGGSNDDSDDLHSRRKRKKKSKKTKNRKDNLFTRLRDSIAESDVFVDKHSQPVHLTSIELTIALLPPFAILLIWDTLAVEIFEVPHLSTLEHPGFMLVFHFICILFSMYGYCVQFVTTGSNRYVSLAKLSIVSHYCLFLWRVFMELYYDGYRQQDKNYLPRTKDTSNSDE